MEIVNNNIDIKEDVISSQGKWKKTHLSNCDISTTDILNNSVKNNFGASLLGDTRDLFRPKTSDIPNQPGVYKWRDEKGKVIYVGKAKKIGRAHV